MHVDQEKQRERYLSLAKLSLDSFKNRREYEWKVAFGLWSAIAGWTYFAITNVDKFPMTHRFLSYLLVVYMGLCALWLVCWQIPSRIAFHMDKELKHYYMHKAVGEHYDKPKRPDYQLFLKNEWLYTASQFGTTFLFLLLSYIAIAASANGIESEREHSIIVPRTEAATEQSAK